MDDRDKKGRFIKQSRSEQYKLLHERLAAELARERQERKALEPLAEEPSPWWIFK